jgi:hypothetical protein
MHGDKSVEWNFPVALNLLMATAAALAAALVEIVISDRSKLKHIPFISYAKAAASCALASPMGYASLKYISFPLMVLAKSSKPGMCNSFFSSNYRKE